MSTFSFRKTFLSYLNTWIFECFDWARTEPARLFVACYQRDARCLELCRMMNISTKSILLYFHATHCKSCNAYFGNRKRIRCYTSPPKHLQGWEWAPCISSIRWNNGASGGITDIDPEPFQASRMARLLCKAPNPVLQTIRWNNTINTSLTILPCHSFVEKLIQTFWNTRIIHFWTELTDYFWIMVC